MTLLTEVINQPINQLINPFICPFQIYYMKRHWLSCTWAEAPSKPFNALRGEPLIKLTILLFNDIAVIVLKICRWVESAAPLTPTLT